jgi:hypothetical protein
MIPRYQRILFWSLLSASLLMFLFLLHGCQQAREKLTRRRDQTPLAAPIETPSATVRLALANDANGSITLVDRDLALPAETTARARVLLDRLLAEYSYKNSAHPLESGPSVDDVFLLDLPLKPAIAVGPKPAGHSDSLAVANSDSATDPADQDISGPRHVPAGQLAVVNLHGSFADQHPSGVEPEVLTIDSIIGTLYANFPRIVQVRFLVDGQPRATLAGHADLLRTYPVADTSSHAQATALGDDGANR